MKREKWIIAIDGPSSAGKSTLGKALARKYQLKYIDTGAMYRAVAWISKQRGIDWSDETALTYIIQESPIEIQTDNNAIRVVIDGSDVTEYIRTSEIASGASKISALPSVKLAMIHKQREMGNAGGVVMDGRDIATYVFPNADYKFYLDGSLETRAKRRYRELMDKGENVNLKDIILSLKERDYNDSNRAVAPLRIAADAIVVDTTDMDISQTFNTITRIIEELQK
jgi:cytidylate kinase